VPTNKRTLQTVAARTCSRSATRRISPHRRPGP
jgi:hypothetical protein